MCLLCFQDAPLLDWGMSRRQVLGAGSAFFAAATFGGATANDQIAPPSGSSGQPQRGPHNVVFFERSRHRSRIWIERRSQCGCDPR